MLLSGSADKTIKQWDLSRQKCVFTFNAHEGSIKYISMHPFNSEWVVSVDRNGLLLVWKLFTGKVVARQQWQNGILSVAIDWTVGRLVLGLDTGAIIFIEVPAPLYWDKNSILPPWQIKWSSLAFSVRRHSIAGGANR